MLHKAASAATQDKRLAPAAVSCETRARQTSGACGETQRRDLTRDSLTPFLSKNRLTASCWVIGRGEQPIRLDALRLLFSVEAAL